MNDALLILWFAANMLMLPTAIAYTCRLGCAVCRAQWLFVLMVLIEVLLIVRRVHTFDLSLGRDWSGIKASAIVNEYLWPSTISLLVMLAAQEAWRIFQPRDTESRDAQRST